MFEVPAAFLRRRPFMVALATLPALVFGAHAVSRPSPSPPIVPQLVQTEGVRVVRLDTRTFRARWMPVYDMPIAVARTDVHQTVGATVSAHHEPATFREVPVRVLTRTPPEPPSRHRLRSRSASLDVCARHNMRRVNYGKRWRCRR